MAAHFDFGSFDVVGSARKLHERCGVYPIWFGLPDSVVPTFDATDAKSKVFHYSPMDPRHPSSYKFDTVESYMDQYKKSWFGITMKKGGYDCMRHLEIIAAGCIPVMEMRGIPFGTMFPYPKKLLQYVYENQMEISIENRLEIRKVLRANFERYLKASQIVKYMFDVTGTDVESIKKVLFIDEAASFHQNYLTTTVYYGLISLLGHDKIDVVYEMPYLFDDYTGDTSKLYGKGYNYAKCLPASQKTRRVAWKDVNIDDYDLIVLGEFSRNYSKVAKVLSASTAKTWILDGEDIRNVRLPYVKEVLSRCSAAFVRELSEPDPDGDLWHRVEYALYRTLDQPRVPKDIFDIEGFSGMKFKIFLNELLRSYTGVYLEVGVWKGATFCSAIRGNLRNMRKAISVDNWSKFGGPKDVFEANVDLCIADCPSEEQSKVQNVNDDFFTTEQLDKEDLKACQVYFYDGDHSHESQSKALTTIAEDLPDEFIYIVDDYNYSQVRTGTMEGLQKSGLHILKELEIRSNLTNVHVEDRESAKKNWWNGCWIGLVSKTTTMESKPERYFIGPEQFGKTQDLFMPRRLYRGGLLLKEDTSSPTKTIPAASGPSTTSTASSSTSSKRRVRVAVYSIALNEAKHVKRWLDSCADADYRVIADTGSTDGTYELAKSLGATVHKIHVKPWRFDHARTTCLNLVPPDVDFCVPLDLDEVLMPGWKDHLQYALDNGITRPDYKFFVTDTKYYVTFKIHRRDGFCWRRPCHEVIHSYGDDTDRHGFVGLEIKHLQDTSKPRSQYLDLMRIGYAENPKDTQQAFWFGRELHFNGFDDEASKVLIAFTELHDSWAPEVSAAFEYLAIIENRHGRKDSAVNRFKQAIEKTPTRRDPYVAYAKYLIAEKNFVEACKVLRACLQIKEQPTDYISRAESWNGVPEQLLQQALENTTSECDD